MCVCYCVYGTYMYVYSKCWFTIHDDVLLASIQHIAKQIYLKKTWTHTHSDTSILVLYTHAQQKHLHTHHTHTLSCTQTHTCMYCTHSNTQPYIIWLSVTVSPWPLTTEDFFNSFFHSYTSNRLFLCVFFLLL